MRKFSLPVAILVGFSLSTAGWLSFDAGRRIQTSKVEKPIAQKLQEVESSSAERLAEQLVTSEAEVSTSEPEEDLSFAFEQLDQEVSRDSFAADGFVCEPIKGDPKSTFLGLSVGFKIKKQNKQLLKIKPTDDSLARWLSFPITNSASKNGKQNSRFRRYSNDVIGSTVKRMKTPFVDITGDGVSDVVVAGYSGGIHCCYQYDVYSLKPPARKYDQIDGAHSPIQFVDIDGDGKFEAIGNDWTFAYWETCFADSPAPLVILSPTERGYELNVPLMKLRPPSKNELIALVEECGGEVNEDREQVKATGIMYHDQPSLAVRPAVWSTMLDLIYTGNSKFAWKFLDMYWPDGENASYGFDGEKDLSKSQFKKEFLDQLSSSPYWKELKALNRNDRFLRSHR